MKKSLFLAMSALLIAGLSGCGAKSEPESQAMQQQRMQSQTTNNGERKQVVPAAQPGTTSP